MSNFVVSNAEQTQDAVNFLLTTKAPGVISLADSFQISGANEYVQWVPYQNVAFDTFYEFGALDQNSNPVAVNPWLLQATTTQPNQKVLGFVGMNSTWVQWDPASTGTFTARYSVSRRSLNENPGPIEISGVYGDFINQYYQYASPGRALFAAGDFVTFNLFDPVGYNGFYQVISDDGYTIRVAGGETAPYVSGGFATIYGVAEVFRTDLGADTSLAGGGFAYGQTNAYYFNLIQAGFQDTVAIPGLYEYVIGLSFVEDTPSTVTIEDAYSVNTVFTVFTVS